MGIRTPALRDEMRMLRMRETPAEAPAVRNICAGSEAYPSRS